MEYFVKFKNFQSHPEGTGKLHYQVLKQHGEVLWGQWRKGNTLLNRKIKAEMNELAPFTLYILDKEVALLQLTVSHVYDREEVIEKNMEHLIPSYYDIDTPCSAFYLVTNIEILPPTEAIQIVNINTGSSIYHSAQVNSTTPWRVCRTDEPVPEPVIKKVDTIVSLPSKEEEVSTSNTYWVYRYYSKTTNKSYIGMTNNLTRRRKEHENMATWKREKKKYLYVMMSMLGLDDFQFEVLHEGLTEEEAHHWEAQEIENYSAYYPSGLNERNESRYL
jgi:hypothetical protein